MADRLVDPRFDAFCRWAALWPAARQRLGQPETQKAFAREIGVSEQTLCAWKRLPEYRQLVRQYTDEAAELTRPLIVGAMIETASKPGKDGFQDRKLYFQRGGELVERQEVKQETRVDVTVRSVRTMTMDELERSALALIRSKYPGKSEEDLQQLLDIHLNLLMLEENMGEKSA